MNLYWEFFLYSISDLFFFIIYSSRKQFITWWRFHPEKAIKLNLDFVQISFPEQPDTQYPRRTIEKEIQSLNCPARVRSDWFLAGLCWPHYSGRESHIGVSDRADRAQAMNNSILVWGDVASKK